MDWRGKLSGRFQHLGQDEWVVMAKLIMGQVGTRSGSRYSGVVDMLMQKLGGGVAASQVEPLEGGDVGTDRAWGKGGEFHVGDAGFVCYHCTNNRGFRLVG